MAKFEDSIDYVLVNEGGFIVDDAGPTNFGITIPTLAFHRNVPANTLSEDNIKNLTIEEAMEVYRFQYFEVMNLHRILDQKIATCIFDTAVNRGISIAAKYAQKTMNAVKQLNLAVDGKIEKESLKAINSCLRESFIRSYENLVWAAYSAIIERDPAKYGKYSKGWQKRAERLLTLI